MKQKPQLESSEIELIEISAIGFSPTNPRRTYSSEGLEELAESIKAHGVLAPVVVRPTGDRFELVVGERRVRASVIAMVGHVPAIVRELTDIEVEDLQIVENVQREDVDLIEQGEGYRRLVRDRSWSVELLAERVGKKTRYIYGLMKLADVPESARAAFRSGKLTKSHLELIARIPDPDQREKATGQILHPPAWQAGDGGVLPVRASAQLIERDYSRELKRAPFSRKDAELLPEAGACDACPHMAGNNPLFEGTRADVCTLPSCYERKLAAHNAKLIERHRADGAEIMPVKQAKELFNGTTLTWNAGKEFVDLDARCQEDSKGRSFGQIVKDQVKPVIAEDMHGTPHRLAARAEVSKLLKKAGVQQTPKVSKSSSQTVEQKKAEDERKVREAVVARIAGLAAAKAQRQWVTMSGPVSLLSFFLEQVIASGSFGDVFSKLDKAAIRRKWISEKEAKEDFDAADKRIREMLPKMTVPEMIALIIECVFLKAGEYVYHEYNQRFLALAKGWGFDLREIASKVRAELKKCSKSSTKPDAEKKPGRAKAAGR